jgi:hypothetical protein
VPHRGRQRTHHNQRPKRARKHDQARVSHRHDRGDEKRLVADFRGENHEECGRERVEVVLRGLDRDGGHAVGDGGVVVESAPGGSIVRPDHVVAVQLLRMGALRDLSILRALYCGHALFWCAGWTRVRCYGGFMFIERGTSTSRLVFLGRHFWSTHTVASTNMSKRQIRIIHDTNDDGTSYYKKMHI